MRQLYFQIFSGIPKIFLMQYCRGDDYGYAQPVEVRLSKRAFAAPPGSPSVQKKTMTVPAVSDIIIINSTIPGYVANRNTVRGTWMVQCLGNFFDILDFTFCK